MIEDAIKLRVEEGGGKMKRKLEGQQFFQYFNISKQVQYRPFIGPPCQQMNCVLLILQKESIK